MITDKLDPMMILILIMVVAIIIFLLVIEPRIARKKIKNKNEHGSSKFADLKEINKTFLKQNIENIDDAGFPIWYEKSNNKFTNVYFDNTSPHWTLIGSTGSGKSTCVVLPECLMFATAKNKRSIIATDPKGELFEHTSKVFKDNGYNVITIDFRNPTLSNRINIMQPIIDEWKQHCINDEKLFICLCHLFRKMDIDLEKFVENDYRVKFEKKIDKYLLEYSLSNIESISQAIDNHSNILYDKSKFGNDFLDIKNLTLEDYFDKLTNKKILEYIKEFQNKSSLFQAEAIRLVTSLADLIFIEKETKDPFWLNSAKGLFKGICGIFLEDYKLGLIPAEKINISSVKKFQNSSLIKENQIYLQRNLNKRDYGTLSKDALTSILSASENTYKSVTAVFGEKMQIFDDLNVENITSVSEFEFSTLAKEPTVLYIVVPDEDKSYYQLVTIIVGILYKDLTKFANMPENKGVLPRKIEWILDEFANCPPLNDIQTIVSVARSRGMRFQFFIQSFAQLENVYTKEVANIILDNSALCYLKTNTVETAEVIARKLGKATIETNSISKSTDIHKIGANETTSLLGRELLTANEIIALKYKTIIFPTVSNPIFRDTYLYNDVFKQYAGTHKIDREVRMLQKNTQNYYTVEQLKYNYDNKLEVQMQKEIQEMKIESEVDQDNSLSSIIAEIESIFDVRHTNDRLIVNKLISEFEQQKIIDLIEPMINVEIAFNTGNNETIISFFDAEKYRYTL